MSTKKAQAPAPHTPLGSGWDHAKLDLLLAEMEAGFWDLLRNDEKWNAAHPDDEPQDYHSTQGYNLLRLLECKPGAPRPKRPPATIEGPLFTEGAEASHAR